MIARMATKDDSKRFAEAVASQVRAEIAARGESVHSVARTSGINRETLYRWTRGERPFTVGTLFQVAEALGMDTHLIVERAEQRFEEERSRLAPVTVGRFRQDEVETPDELRVAHPRSTDRGEDLE